MVSTRSQTLAQGTTTTKVDYSDTHHPVDDYISSEDESTKQAGNREIANMDDQDDPFSNFDFDQSKLVNFDLSILVAPPGSGRNTDPTSVADEASDTTLIGTTAAAAHENSSSNFTGAATDVDSGENSLTRFPDATDDPTIDVSLRRSESQVAAAAADASAFSGLTYPTIRPTAQGVYRSLAATASTRAGSAEARGRFDPICPHPDNQEPDLSQYDFSNLTTPQSTFMTWDASSGASRSTETPSKQKRDDGDGKRSKKRQKNNSDRVDVTPTARRSLQNLRPAPARLSGLQIPPVDAPAPRDNSSRDVSRGFPGIGTGSSSFTGSEHSRHGNTLASP
ncbi:hypothetical protein F4779DRAFT_615103 [Xylariaceae sp. FL0662B]|nr:hypothetical protein F4779DRAFT_615103 [Xylariaceae sp. FL0662B]